MLHLDPFRMEIPRGTTLSGIQMHPMITSFSEFLILSINEYAEGIMVLFCFVLFFCVHLFGRTLTKMNIPKLKLKIVSAAISKKSLKSFHPVRKTIPVLNRVRDPSVSYGRKYFTIHVTIVGCDAIWLTTFTKALVFLVQHSHCGGKRS